MTFESFKAKVESAGLQAVDCGNFHWRIVGGPVAVNWYLMSKGSTIYCNGATGRTSFSGTAEQAIEAALGKARTMAPGVNPTKRMGPNRSRKLKLKWWRTGRRSCYWCRARMTDIRQMTVEHIVPLFRGGSNEDNNLAPACQDCNHGRGHQLGGKHE